MFAIGELDKDGRQKRIEHRGKYLRISRTGDVALRANAKVTGANFTVNTKRGIRVSTRIAKGTSVAFQNGKFQFKGRYGKGPTKLNLSKSGVSVSTKNRIGTFNWMNPNRSSTKVMGVQVRGKSAAYFQIFFFLIIFFWKLISGFARLCKWILNGIVYLFWWSLKLVYILTVKLPIRVIRAIAYRVLIKRARTAVNESSIGVFEWPAEKLADCLIYGITVWGRGQTYGDRESEIFQLSDRQVIVAEIGPEFDSFAGLLFGKDDFKKVRLLLISVMSTYHSKGLDSMQSEIFFEIDEQCVRDGGRTVFQNKLLQDYVDLVGVSVNINNEAFGE